MVQIPHLLWSAIIIIKEQKPKNCSYFILGIFYGYAQYF